jgi:nicotinamide-nucleotide amidase
MFAPALLAQAQALLAAARAKGLKIATAESCTGGLVAGLLTEIAGSSDVVERGFITYSNEAKTDLLGVPPGTLAAQGAVSEQTALAMAAGALVNSRADIVVAVTGIAGPKSDDSDKPVGLVHFAAARGDTIIHRECRFGAIGREQVRLKSVETALQMLAELVGA